MESEKRKVIEEKVEEERLQIVEQTKAFVMEREKVNEEQTRDLREKLESKDKRIETILKKLAHAEEDCKEKQFQLEQEQISCEKLVAAAEERVSQAGNDGQKARFNGDELSELHERLQSAKTQNEDLRNDIAKMVDDYEKERDKEKREMKKLKTQNEKLKSQYEKKDVELKKYMTSSKEPIKNSKMLEDLRTKLLSSDEKFVEIQLEKEDLERLMKTKSSDHEKEVHKLNKRLSSLLEDNERLRKKIEEISNTLSTLTKENSKFKQERAQFPFLKGTGVTPLTQSMSGLKVLSTEEESTDSEAVTTDASFKTPSLPLRANETPKRSSDALSGKHCCLIHVF